MAMESSKDPKKQQSFRILQENNFYSRLLSREISPSAPSFRVYHTVASSAVPFLWESQPGTPKAAAAAGGGNLIPPLTPPPSYLYQRPTSPRRGGSSSAILSITTLLSLLTFRKAPSQEQPRLLSLTAFRRHSRVVSSSSSSMAADEDPHEPAGSSPKSTLCFLGRRPSREKISSLAKSLSVAGRGSQRRGQVTC